MTPEQITELRQKKYNATVARLHRANPELMLLRVRPDFALPTHQPGQYTTLGLGFWEPRFPGCQEEQLQPGDELRVARRAYSISCPILDDQSQLLDLAQTDWLEFYIVLVRQAEKAPPALTPRLFMLRAGDRLFLSEKITGHFTLDPVKPGDTVLFLSTGTGEAPHNYLLWELLRKGHQGRILSACCVRYRQDLGYLSTHELLASRYPNYTYLALTTREADTINRKVYIQDLLTSGELEQRLGAALDPAKTHVFLCGNPKMIGVPEKDRETGARVYPKPLGVIEILEQRGFQVDQPNIKLKGNIHYEEYW
jgi:ferredoxin/flavodoxin---NADP+ reductase